MNAHITPDSAPALGTIRRLAGGDVVVIHPGATGRPDWGRYQEAIGAAVTRGSDVQHVTS